MPTADPPFIPLFYKAYTAFITVACAILCVLLLRANAANRALRDSAADALQRLGARGLAVGEHVEPLRVVAAKGLEPGATEGLIRYDDGRLGTALFLLSGGCDACKQSFPAFIRLADLAAANAIVPVAIQLDASDSVPIAYEPTPGLPVVAVDIQPGAWLRRIPIVPAVVLVDPRGAVTHAVFGELSPSQTSDLDRALTSRPGQR